MADNSFIAKAMPFVEAHFGNVKKYATEQEAREAFYQEMQRQGFTKEELGNAWGMACYYYFK